MKALNRFDMLRALHNLTEKGVTYTNNPKVYKRLIMVNNKLNMKTIWRYTDEYGFRNIEVRPKGGGSKSITFYGGTSDIGFMSSVNKHGLGGGDYIRNIGEINKHIADINRTVWLTEIEKSALIQFLHMIRKECSK